MIKTDKQINDGINVNSYNVLGCSLESAKSFSFFSLLLEINNFLLILDK